MDGGTAQLWFNPKPFGNFVEPLDAFVKIVGMGRQRCVCSIRTCKPGPHQSECVSFQSSQSFRECSVSRFSRENPARPRTALPLRLPASRGPYAPSQPCYERHVLDIAHTSDRTSTPCGPVHATGIQLDHAFFVGEATQANAVIVGSSSGREPRAGRHRAYRHLCAEFRSLRRVVEAVAGGNYDGVCWCALSLLRFCLVSLGLQDSDHGTKSSCA